MDLLEGVLDVAPLLRWVVSILLKNHSVSVKSLASIVGAPDNNDPFNVVSVAGVLGEVDVVRGTELSRAAALVVIVRGERPQRSIRSIPVGLRRAVVVQLVDVAVILGVARILSTVDLGLAGKTGTSGQVPLTIII